MIQILAHYNGTLEIFREPEGSDRFVKVIPSSGAKVKLYKAERQRGAAWTQARNMEVEAECFLQIHVTGLADYKHYVYISKKGGEALRFLNDERALMARQTFLTAQGKGSDWKRLGEPIKISPLQYGTRFSRSIFEEDDDDVSEPPLPTIEPPSVPKVAPPQPQPTVEAALPPTKLRGALDLVGLRAAFDDILESILKR